MTIADAQRVSPLEAPPRPLRVLMVVEAALAGVGRHALDLCEHLLAGGHEPHLVYSPRRMDPPFAERLEAMSELPRLALPMKRGIGLADFQAARAVARYAREQGPFDILHGHSSKGGAIARLAGRRAKVPAVYTPNAISSMNPRTGRLGRLAATRVERWLGAMTAQIIAVSPEEREHLLEHRIAGDRVSLVPNGIRFPALPTPGEAREALGLPADKVVIGTVGRLSPQKAPEVLLEAFARVAGVHRDTRLAIIGRGELEDDLRRRADGLGIADRIHWLGQQPGAVSMPAFDIFALPSRYEGLPYVLLEALAAGLPIVTTTAAGARLLVTPGETGEMVPPDQPGPFADALIELVGDPDRRRAFGEAARRKGSTFSLEAMAEQTLAVYARVLTGLPSRR
ncbi:MAG: glycosyltransferase family 4 protein [Phycisphaeraceae bacterium]